MMVAGGGGGDGRSGYNRGGDCWGGVARAGVNRGE